MQPSIFSMAFATLLGAGLVLPNAAAGADAIKLTGLLDLGSCRVACLELDSSALTLHSGETAAGITLKDLDARAGWALFVQGTNLLRVRVFERNGLATAPGGSAPATAPSLPAGQFAQPASNSLPSDSPNSLREAPGPSDVNSRRALYALPAGAYTTPWLEGYLGENRSSNLSLPGSTSSAGGAPVPNPASVAIEVSSSPAQPVASATVELAPDQPATPPISEATGTSPRARGAINPLEEEGEMIRGFYGLEAFLAWDLAHPDRK